MAFRLFKTTKQHAVTQLGEVLGYKPEGRGFNSRWCYWNNWHNPSGRTTTLKLTEPLIDISTTNISWGVKVTGAQG